MKRLVFCFDGSWNRLDTPYPTNVLLTAESVLPMADGVVQVTFTTRASAVSRARNWPAACSAPGSSRTSPTAIAS